MVSSVTETIQNRMKIVIALGGNAILRRGEKGTAEEQFSHVQAAATCIAGLITEGHSVVITHGNGPQVGDILLKEECARGTLPEMPLDICGAMSQGMLGYMLQQSLGNALHEREITKPVISVITQTLVDPDDPAFSRPEKPIGPYYESQNAAPEGRILRSAGSGQFRRVVASPDPLQIIEGEAIRMLTDQGVILIAAGGGGIPVIRDGSGRLTGVEAVVDKDLAAEKLARVAGASLLLILTDVPSVYRAFGTPEEEAIGTITTIEARNLLLAGEFPEGSMAPKILACVRFAEAGGEAVITSPAHAYEAVKGLAGTRIIPV